MRKFKTQSKPRIQFTTKLTPQECNIINELNKDKIKSGVTPKYLYVTTPQWNLLHAKQTTKLMLGGRGCGKTRGCIGYGSALRVQQLPGARLFLAGPTFNHILKFLIGEIKEAWEALGWEKDKDFVMWKRPPKHWDKPIKSPELFEYTISFRNGACIDLVSLDRPNLVRGMSFDGGDWDEYALAKETHWQDIIAPTLRGNIDKFHGKTIHQNVNFYTSMPRTSDGFHVFNMEENAKTYPDEFFFIESNLYDNIHFWGEKGIERLKKEMSHLRWEMEVMNRRIRKAERAFYNKFNPEHHTKLFHYDYSFNETGHVSKGLKELQRTQPIDVSFDFGGWFTCCTASQLDEKANVDRTFSEFFKNGDDMLRPVIHDFCKFFEKEGQRMRFVRVYGEPRGHDKRPDGETLYKKVQQYFSEFNWACEIMVAEGSKTDEHAFRFELVNEFLAETNPDLPRLEINLDLCPNLIIALQATAVTHDYKKDKSKEKDRDYPQEHAPHLTDAFDYKLVQKYLYQIYASVDRPSGAGSL